MKFLDYESCLYLKQFVKFVIVCLENTTSFYCVIIDPSFSSCASCFYFKYFYLMLSKTALYLNIPDVKNTEKRGHQNFVTHNLATETSKKWYHISKHCSHIVAHSSFITKMSHGIVYAGNDNAHAQALVYIPGDLRPRNMYNSCIA